MDQPVEQAKTQDQKPETEKGFSLSTFIKKYPVLAAIICGLIAVAIVYFWKDIQMKKAKGEITRKADEQLLQNNQDMLKLMCKPLVWSIRSEMLRGNMEQVNVFTTDLVKEKNFQFIHIVDPAGTIIVSTDKKLEGQPAEGKIDALALTTDSIMVMKKESNLLSVSAPVMGFEKRLATIIFYYKPVGFEVNSKK